jgi:threonyl-tRNA synthetase
MKKILDRLGLEYTEAVGEAAFYGPKLDLQMRNVFGKEDTVITVQVDFANADRFNMEYVDESGVKRRPIIIHRSSIGCYERTLALLIEKFGGALPLWLAPEQVVVMSLTDRTVKDAHKTAERLKAKGIRATVDVRTEKIGYKIREAQLNKIPYMLIIGDKDKEAKVVSVRSRSAGDIGATKLADFIKKVQKEVKGMAK